VANDFACFVDFLAYVKAVFADGGH